MTCREIVAGEVVCSERPWHDDAQFVERLFDRRAVFTAGESRELFNFAPRSPFDRPSRSDYRREFPFHLDEQS